MSENETPTTLAFEDFLKVDIRVGFIESAERVPKSDKLLKLQVDFGELGKRQILAGIGKSYAPEVVIGRRAAFVVNLAPRKMMGLESHGMILAAADWLGEDKVVVLAFETGKVGARIG
jgi:methionyl-tRNA synthetase